MEILESICLQTLIDNITLYLSGCAIKNSSIIKVNNDSLSVIGELHFLPSLKAWKSVIKNGSECNENCNTVLQHFMHIRGTKITKENSANVTAEALQLLISASNEWSIQISKCCLQREQICIFLNRIPLITNAVQAVMKYGSNFGKNSTATGTFNLKYAPDTESELTTRRLHLIWKVTEKMLNLHGYKTDEDSSLKYVFTTKSEGKVDETFEKYMCGVVKNLQCNTKEKSLTWEKHIQNKISELKQMNEHKFFDTEKNAKHQSTILEHIAEATAIFEVLAIKPSRPVFIGSASAADRRITNTKGASFVLYNTARIATILEKYNNKRLKGEYPSLLDINNVDFSLLDLEEEWELIYNFIIGYPEIIKDCVKYKSTFQINPHIICQFLARLSQKFSIYYRKTRILTESYDHLMPIMFARLYMLQALQIVLENALAILDIHSVSHM